MDAGTNHAVNLVRANHAYLRRQIHELQTNVRSEALRK